MQPDVAPQPARGMLRGAFVPLTCSLRFPT
jgi:hypothetical protein